MNDLIKSTLDKVAASNPNNTTTVNTQPDAVESNRTPSGVLGLGNNNNPGQASEKSLSLPKPAGEIEDIIK